MEYLIVGCRTHPPSLPPLALAATSLLQFLLPVEKLHLANVLRVPGTLRGVQDLPCFWPGSVSRSCFLLPRLHASFQRVVMKAGGVGVRSRGVVTAMRPASVDYFK